MIYIQYLVLAAGVVFFSLKAGKYVDLLDKKTSLSGAFIGGVLLSAVTSLPEVFTSLSSAILLDSPGLAIGNILGSNLFNLCVLATLIIFARTEFFKVRIAPSHIKVGLYVLTIYGILLLNMVGILSLSFLSISLTSVLALIIYVIAIRDLSDEDANSGEEEEEVEDDGLTVRQVVIRFIGVSIGIVVLSILISYVTDELSEALNLGQGLAGALFLGVATSLPELSSTQALFKIKNYNIAIGNIIGSNLFNFATLAFVDILYTGTSGVYDYSDPKTVNLLLFGILASISIVLVLKLKNNKLRLLSTFPILISYVLFLVV